MDVFKPAFDNSLSPKVCVSPSNGTEPEVVCWPAPEHCISATGTVASGYWTAVFEYEASAEDELSLRKGDLVEVLSKDSLVSGDEGWWTGVIEDRVGIFPSNYVSSGNGISEKIRDTTEEEYSEYSVPPLHREYLIVLYTGAMLISVHLFHIGREHSLLSSAMSFFTDAVHFGIEACY